MEKAPKENPVCPVLRVQGAKLAREATKERRVPPVLVVLRVQGAPKETGVKLAHRVKPVYKAPLVLY